MLILFKRVVKIGLKSLSRNIGSNLATVFVMVMVISVVTLLFLLNSASDILISSFQEKVDLSVYFKKDVATEMILSIKSEISNIPEVKSVEFVSRDKALENFISRHKDDPVLMESLTEVGENPFLASLDIKAWQSSQYGQVANLLESGPFGDLINKVDYYKRKPIIDRVFSITSGLNKAGFFLGIFFGLIAVLIVFNTIRIAIYNSGKEISVMRLVGASNSFIRGPFLVQGAIVGFIAALITFFLTFAFCWGFNSKIQGIAPEVSTLGLFVSNIWILILLQLASGVGLGIVSSMIAIRKYLRV